MKEKLLLLHGAIGGQNQFRFLKEELKNRFEVFSINFSGHGGLSLPPSFSIGLFMEDVLLFLEQEKIKSINIFGYSMGGYVALALAKKYPEKIKKIITLATKFDWTAESSLKESKNLNPELILEKFPAFAKELEHLHSSTNWKLVLVKTADMLNEMGKNPPLKWGNFNSISTPTLLALGENDKMVSQDETIKVNQEMLYSKIHILPGAPHSIEKISTKLLVEMMENFFS